MVFSKTWNDPQGMVKLNDDEVHVWRAAVDLDEKDILNNLRLLSPDEREQADRFHFLKDRTRFIARRGTLRSLLSRYIHCPPEQIHFEYSAFGKPEVGKSLNPEHIFFNLSHSNGIALFAISRQAMMGIDIEYMRVDVDLSAIAATAFSTCELEQMQALPDEFRMEAFYNCWTRKEAFIKATGKGLSFPLKSFDVSLSNTMPKILQIEGCPEASFSWQLEDLTVEPGYKAALAVRREKKDLEISLWNYYQ